MKTKIIVVDDHSVFRSGLIKVLETEPNIEIVGDVNDGRNAISLAKKLKPNIVILDIEMPGSNGIDVARELKSINAKIKIILLSMHLNPNFIFDALSAGIEGYVTKMSEMEEVLKAIQMVIQGSEYFSKDVAQFAMENYHDYHKRKTPKSFGAPPLTKREKEIIAYISEGLNYKQIAQKLEISQFTVVNHRQNIIHKLGLKSNADLIRYAISHNLTDIPLET